MSLCLCGAVAVASCTDNTRPPTPKIADDFGDSVALDTHPKRIVSLSPATTEILFTIGAGDRVIGRTHWDMYPPAAARVPDLGTGIRPNVEAVLGAKPDLVLLYASSDNKPAAQRLHAAGIKTLSLKTDRIGDFFRATKLIGRAVGDSARAIVVADSVRRTLDHVRETTMHLPPRTAFWHIWDSPLITVGGGSYMTQLLVVAGARNIYGERNDVSLTVSIEDVIKRNPYYIIAGPEGAAKIKADPRWNIAPAVREGRLIVVDTALVGRPAVRLGEAAVALASLIHPEKAEEFRSAEREGMEGEHERR